MTRLYDYQRKGVDAIHRMRGRTLLADEPGCGKTIQALTYLMESRSFPCVVVCPKVAKFVWQEEAWQHYKLPTTVLSGTTPRNLRGLEKTLVVLNYDILIYWLPYLRAFAPKLIIADEAHLCGNHKSKRARALLRLCKGVPKVIGISGTPFTNRPLELWPILSVLCPEEFGSLFSYGVEYCAGRKVFNRWDFSGASNTARLHKLLKQTVMVRRLKKDVLPQLPPRTITVVPLELSRKDKAEYDQAEDDLLLWVRKEFGTAASLRAARAECFSRFSYLKRLAARLKLPDVLEWHREFLDGDSKCLSGFVHRSIGRQLHDAFSAHSVTIHGGRSDSQRREAERLFRRGEARFLFGQVQACGTALNLPEADTVALCELPWTPGACTQFFDRVHRLTTPHPVSAYFFVAVGTVEEELCRILQRKQKALNAVLDGQAQDRTGMSVYDELQQVLLNRKR